MKRGGRLKTYTPLERHTPLRQVSAKRSASQTPAGGGNVPASVRGLKSSSGSRILPDAARIVRERSQGMCEIQLEGCWIEATEKSHRIARGMGGRHGAAKAKSDRPSDLLDACTWCHLVITRHASRVRAKFHGWVLKDYQEPTQTKVFRRGEWVFLADDGSIHSYEDAGA